MSTPVVESMAKLKVDDDASAEVGEAFYILSALYRTNPRAQGRFKGNFVVGPKSGDLAYTLDVAGTCRE